MSEPRWTPGPWLVRENQMDFTVGGGVKRRFYNRVAIMGIKTNSPMRDEGEANAQLIAAAPELFDALASIAAVFCRNGTREDYDNAYREHGIAAINKAIGRT